MPLVFTPFLKRAGYLDNLTMTLANVGSRRLHATDDLGGQGWSVFAPNLTIYGFDADPEACDAANADVKKQGINWQETHIPLVLSHTCGTQTLYVTKNPMCSSLYPPNEPYLERFNGLDVMELDFAMQVETTTLDTFCQQEGVTGVDFLRTDVQGADLDVLRGAQNLLDQSGLAVEVEVIFAPLYVGQPLFANVDMFMREQGFTLMEIRLHPGVPRRVLPMVSKPIYHGQKLWANATYVRDILAPETPDHWRNPEHIFKLACILDVLSGHDYAAELLMYLVEVHQWPLQELLLNAVRAYAPEHLWPQLPLLSYLQNKINA
ncbi:FkbM family methyltransferase [Gloeomargarita lithophora Alchichica-D10]|uniref:FkbM family methyltransferase n=1 Tax=Gloeomargarita lithophora Alchichica-D10 TaxID=1188229 RepID=A0A1J0AGP4_9CYAN|nr:FkbM family methyltransferase [Gloeomargarita lithophora]APB35059.1 FkbM family methyltransferase [Gloeomargarita lithophora Alchichica-D10]